MEATLQGLYVTAAGMILLFLAMGVLMLCMASLARAFPVREPVNKAGTEQPAAPPANDAPAATAPDGRDATIVALAAVAMALSEHARRPFCALPSAGTGEPGPWVIIGRETAMRSRRQG